MRRPSRRPATLVTSAPRSRIEEIDAKRRRYMLTMGTRTVLFVLSVFLFRGALRYVAVALSLVLPWIAVVVANANPPVRRGRPEYVGPDALPQLGAAARSIDSQPEQPGGPER